VVDDADPGPSLLADDLHGLLTAFCNGRGTAAEVLDPGPPAVIRAGSSAPAVLERQVRGLLGDSAGSVLVTRADDAQRAALGRVDPRYGEHARARCAWITRDVPEARGTIVIVSAGTSDGPVVHEARICAELLGTRTVVHEDAGVAGLHRLAPALGDLRAADCVIAVAGMDAALASVIGGLTPAPVIGVPTSTGYGTAFGGLAALLAMLNSCAAALAVVGIDDGVAAAMIGARIARGAGA
jgi:NCAIR mutase (PurE)-related protein